MSNFEEDLDKDTFANPGAYAEATAKKKALAVSARVTSAQVSGQKIPKLVVAADTVVELGGRILEKPQDEDDAFSMLRFLSGKQHNVYTGVVLALPRASESQSQLKLRCFYEQTKVQFAELEDAEILAYIDSGEAMGKSGAYGIQGKASTFVQRIDGCYFNIMGFPLHRFSVEVDDLIRQGDLVLTS